MENETQWDNRAPIYRQLRDRVVAMILEGTLKEGDPLPSVRNVSTRLRPPVTPARAAPLVPCINPPQPAAPAFDMNA